MGIFGDMFGGESEKKGAEFGRESSIYAGKMAGTLKDLREASEKLFGWAEKGKRAPAWLTAPGIEVIEGQAARLREGIEEMAPGGMKEKAQMESGQWTAEQRVQLERDMFRYGVEAMQNTYRTVIGGFQNLSGMYAGMSSQQYALAAQKEAAWLGLVGDAAGAAGMFYGLKGGGKPSGKVIAGGGVATPCWVAEELYGVNHPKTHAARLYVLRNDNWFTRLYKEHGKSWADIIKKYPWLKPVIQPIWDYMAYQGNGRSLWHLDPQ